MTRMNNRRHGPFADAAKMFTRTLLGYAVITFFVCVSAQISAYELPGDEVYPEGIAYDSASNHIYVSSTTEAAILRVNVETGEVDTFSPGGSDGRTGALGMTIDAEGRLWIAGGGTGAAFVYDTATGELIRQYQTPEAESTLLNDVVTTPAGDAYITDSFRPILFKVSAAEGELGEIEPWLDFTGTALEYQEDEVNLNGIETTEDGSYLITVHMTTGQLFRINTQSKEVTEIDLGGETLERGDGLLLDGQTLYVVYNRNPENINVSVVELTEDFSSGTVVSNFTDPSIAPSGATAAKVDDRLLVVVTQFDKREEGNPELPFTVASIPISMLMED